MGVFRWLIGGLICGAVGAAVWAGIAAATQYEIGWLAWGIGFIVGVGVRYGAHLGGEEESDMQGIVAAAIACGSILSAKFILLCMYSGGSELAEARATIDAIPHDEQAMVASLADDYVEAKLGAGEQVNWPPGMNYDNAQVEADYPPEIWKQAQQKWNSLSQAQQQAMQSERLLLIAELKNSLSEATLTFGDLFSPWDFLWFGLALVTAYKVGSGSYGDD